MYDDLLKENRPAFNGFIVHRGDRHATACLRRRVNQPFKMGGGSSEKGAAEIGRCNHSEGGDSRKKGK